MINLIIVELECEHTKEESFEQLARQCRTSCSIYQRIRWLRTLVSSDGIPRAGNTNRKRFISELEAPDAESVRELFRQQRIPFDRVWKATEKRNLS